MKVTYYALKPIQVGDAVRQPGDLIPEAADWNMRHFYLQDGSIASVLVVTLPQEVQDTLKAWEQAQNPGREGEAEDEQPEDDESTGEQPEVEPPAPAPKVDQKADDKKAVGATKEKKS